MNFINTETNAYPVSEGDIRNLFPSVSFANPFAPPAGFAAVNEVPKPAFNPHTQTVRESTPVLGAGGAFEQNWEIVALDGAASAASLAAAKAHIWEQIKSYRDNAVQNGGFFVSGKWFHSDTFSRSQHMALYVLGANIPTGIQWKTMDGTFIEMTQALAAGVFNAGVASDAALFGYAETLKSQVDASGTPDAVNIYAGWPATFTA